MANASTKDEATKMLDKLASMIRSIEPPAPTEDDSLNGPPVDIPVEDLPEDMDLEAVDDAVHDALAEAQAAALKAGKELSKDESKTIQKKARENKMRAMGQFSLVMRGKKEKGKPKLVGGSPQIA